MSNFELGIGCAIVSICLGLYSGSRFAVFGGILLMALHILLHSISN